MADPVRVAMIGTAHPHAPGKMEVLRSLSCFEVAGAVEANAGIRSGRAAEQAFAGAPWLTAGQVLADRRIEAVLVEGRVSENLPAAEAAVAAGKHVHLEKPAGTDLAAFRDLLEEVRARGLHLQMGYMLRHNRAFRLLFRAVREGWLGDLFAVHGDMSTGAMPAGKRLEHARYPGGMMFELGCHLIDILVALLGRPVEVAPYLARHGADALADNTLAVFRFPSATATIAIAALEPSPFARRRFEVLGTDGALVIEPLEPPSVRLCLRRPTGGFLAGWQDVAVENVPRYRDDLAEWAACIRGKGTPSFAPEHDLLVQETVLRAGGISPDR